ncbi:serine hydrolase [Agromyces sp. LHK192]|uniref:serine hydrolase domain-containing protein n=1 Tax=Agromyces sp. LHK192 TaxID=2498704 RepID=UPI000FDB5939|nr:serine hydrolase domain-containing protein [Agromyces sp. LHK192]
MGGRRTRAHRFTTRAATLAAMGLVALTLTACIGGAASDERPAPTATHAPVDGSAAACVADPEAVAGQDDTQEGHPVDDDLAARYDDAASAVFHQVAEVAPGAIVGVRGPDGTFTAAYGTADLATGAAAETDQHVRIASVTKSFVGTVVLRLADEGRLSLDDPIDDYVPDVPNGSRITLRELITMRSGLGNYSDDEQWGLEMLADPEAEWSPDRLLEYAWSMPTSFPPGTNMEYSNTNFILLGLVVEQVTGERLTDVIRAEVLEPLALAETAYPADNTLPSPRMQGYTLPAVVTPAAGASPEWVDATDWSPSSAGAAGAMTSDLDDLLAWGRALATGQGVLEASAQVERLESFATSTLGPREFYGQALVCRDGWIGHHGNIPGYNTVVRYHPAIDTTIVVVASGLSGTATPPRVLVIEEYASALADVAGQPFTATVVPPEAQVQGLVPVMPPGGF